MGQKNTETGKIISATLRWTKEKQGKYEVNRVYIKFTPKDITSFLNEYGWEDGEKLFVGLGKNHMFISKNQEYIKEIAKIPKRLDIIEQKLNKIDKLIEKKLKK